MPLPSAEFEVKSYRCSFRSWPQDPNIQDSNRLDTISLLDGRDRIKAVLRFLRAGPLPPNDPNGDAYIAYFLQSDFPAIIDLLRNERPITFQFGVSEHGLHRAALFTGNPEPVGEGERNW